jgi:hypothetical protein
MMQRSLPMFYLDPSNNISERSRKGWVSLICFSRGGDG